MFVLNDQNLHKFTLNGSQQNFKKEKILWLFARTIWKTTNIKQHKDDHEYNTCSIV